MNTFSALGEIYDSYNGSAGYDAYLELICKEFSSLSTHAADYQPRVVDLGCGTGEMALRLAKRGFDVIGIDRSSEMLSEAMQKKDENPEVSLFFVRQDMRSFQMDAKANLFISCYDCLNYLTDKKELGETFARVAAHTVSGGVFIFDLNTLYRFRDYYGDRVFCFKQSDSVLIWENRFDVKSNVSYFDIDVFRKEGTLYRRSREKHKQTWFSDETVDNALAVNGFRTVRTLSSCELWGHSGESIKTVYVTQKQ